jgi:hypothetical protein
MNVSEWLKHYDLKRDDHGIWRGHVYMTELYEMRWPIGAQSQDWTINGYREVWVSERERTILTYCEGDLDVTIDDTEEAFRARLASAEQFYTGRQVPA